MTIGEAVRARVSRLRRDPWAPDNYIELTLIETSDGTGYGPWAQVHDPFVDDPSIRYEGWREPPPILAWQLPDDDCWEEHNPTKGSEG